MGYIILIFALFFVSCKYSHNNHISNSKLSQEKTKQFDEKTDTSILSYEKKINWFTQDAVMYHSIDSISENFNLFYDRFISDSAYQINHVNFPIYGDYEDYNGSITIPTSDNWIFIEFDFRSDFTNKIDSNFFFQNDSKFYYESYRKEVGLMTALGFEKINNEWYLVLFRFNPL